MISSNVNSLGVPNHPKTKIFRKAAIDLQTKVLLKRQPFSKEVCVSWFLLLESEVSERIGARSLTFEQRRGISILDLPLPVQPVRLEVREALCPSRAPFLDKVSRHRSPFNAAFQSMHEAT